MEKKDYSYTVEINADPVPKGRPRFRFGPNGRPITYTPKGTRVYETIIQDCIEDQLPDNPFDGPFSCRLLFYLERPKSHFTPKGALKKGAPVYPCSNRCGDLDNFTKAVMDAAQNSKLITDDRYMCDLVAHKRYADDCLPRVILSIEPLK